MGICSGIDQLGAHPHPTGRALDGAFYHVRHTERLSDVAQVSLGGIFVLHYGRAANYFKIGDFGKVGQNFVLNAIREVGILFLLA